MMWSRHQFSHPNSNSLRRMLAGKRSEGAWASIELSAEEAAALQALWDDRNALEADRNRLEALLDQERTRAKFRSQEAPWASYERLRAIAIKGEPAPIEGVIHPPATFFVRLQRAWKALMVK